VRASHDDRRTAIDGTWYLSFHAEVMNTRAKAELRQRPRGTWNRQPRPALLQGCTRSIRAFVWQANRHVGFHSVAAQDRHAELAYVLAPRI